MNKTLDLIRDFVEQALIAAGVHGHAVPVLRHVLLIVLTVLLAWLFYAVCRHLLMPLLLKLVRKTSMEWDDVLFNDTVLKSACRIVPALVVWEFLPLVFYQFPLVREVLARLTAIYIAVMVTRTLLALTASFRELADTGQRRSSAQQYLRSLCGVIKVALVFAAIIVVIALAIGQSPLKLFAGLGATSAVMMLVFKDTIVGLVAGVRLTNNNMLHKGDWITVPGTQINGVVTDISLTTVKVRNFDNTIFTISPVTLVSGSFQNWIGMQRSNGRRVQRKVFFDVHSIRFVGRADEKPGDGIPPIRMTNMGLFRRDIEQWLRHRADVNPDMLCMVRQLEATDSGIPVEFYFFLRQKEWRQYENHLAVIMEYIYASASGYGLKVYEQYPDQRSVQ